MIGQILAITGLISSVSATLVAPAVGAWPTASTVHLIPKTANAASPSAYINEAGNLASGRLPTNSITPTNFTIVYLPTPPNAVGWFALKSPAGSCTILGNAAGGQLVCGNTNVTGQPSNEYTVFQSYTLPGSTTLYLSLLEGSETWWAKASLTTLDPPPPETVFNGAIPAANVGLGSAFNITLVAA